MEEGYAAGVRRMIFVTGRNKRAIEDHFDTAYELEAADKQAMLDVVRSIKPDDMHCVYVRQPKALGLGHAVLCAEHLVGKEPFAVLLALQDVPREHTPRYGIVDVQGSADQLAQVRAMVEKPAPEVAPSTLAVAGRYVLTPAIFDSIRAQPRGAGGEIQLTDGIAGLMGQEKVHAYRYRGTRYDCGSKEGYVQATMELTLRDAGLASTVRGVLNGRLWPDNLLSKSK